MKTEVVREASFTSWYDVDEIAQIGMFRFIGEIASDGYDFVLHAMFVLEPMTRFECRSYMSVLRSSSESAS